MSFDDYVLRPVIDYRIEVSLPTERWKIYMYEDKKTPYILKMTQYLPAMRNMLHLSQEALASRLNVSRQQVAAIETSKRKMSWSIFLSLVLIFSLNESTLLMMKTFEIYTPELISMIEGSETTNQQSAG